MLIKLNTKSASGNIFKGSNKVINKDWGIIRIAKELQAGKVAILPASTMYGISCIYDSKVSVRRVYEIKKRPVSMPFIILIPDISYLGLLAENVSRYALSLIERYWLSEKPEPLTLVFKKNKKTSWFPGAPYRLKQPVSRPAACRKDTIALRLDPMREINEILKICGPVLSTSAAISGTGILPKTIKEIPNSIKNDVDFMVDCQVELAGVASTVLDVTGKEAVLLREGGLKFKNILSELKYSV